MNLYYFTDINEIPGLIQPVYAENSIKARKLFAARHRTIAATYYTEMQWPTVKARLEKRFGKNLTVLDPINEPTLPEGA